ncbi:VOC family protein [Paenibacillus oceani]|uniref:Glyoxalase n=1 Tax=Paenibacillus oceani TaxID=2772510 RepID=A0A927C9G3_9BACL|nr:glyoxalase [Paenibacillus oceani]MBD2863879.1 glyoxalase [Paenibacillus oceani]
MQAIKLKPFVPSGDDYGLAQRFFEELGFEKIYADNGITIFRLDELEFYLQNFHNRELQDNFMVELVVSDLDGWWTRIRRITENGEYPVRCKEPTLYPWGKREVHLIDPAGVCWHLSEAKRQ